MPAGRPTKYRDSYPAMAHAACAELGATNAQLARLFGVGATTLDRWLARYAEFRGAIKRGKELFDSRTVEQSLLKRACGYRYSEERFLLGDNGPELSRVVHKEMPPDITALIFWLCNRSPKRWQRNPRVEHAVGSDLLKELELGRERAARLAEAKPPVAE